MQGTLLTNELMYIRFLQISVLALTFVFIFGIMQVKKGNVSLHRKINSAVLTITAIAVVGLVVTVILGWDYNAMKVEDALIGLGPQSMTSRISIHRLFSSPLFFSLIVTAYSGHTNQISLHKKSIKFTSFFWLGTLITAWLFF
jgi:uncharacterized membrane protein YozB (DUF420 family)